MESESAAIARVLAGEGDGFRVIVDRYSQALFRLAYRMTGSESDAEDAVQETFVRAYRNLASYDGRAAFSTWLYRIGTNYTLDLLAARKRRTAESLDDTESGLGAVISSENPNPERMAMSAETTSLLNRAMSRLTDQERTAFVLRHYEQQSITEISSALGVGEGATKNSIFRAVQKLRQALQPFTGGGQ